MKRQILAAYRVFFSTLNMYLIHNMKTNYSIEEWDETHPRWREFLACLEVAAPEQAPFVLGEYYRAYPSYLLVALQSNQVVGFIRFAVQPIGSEAKCPILHLNGARLTEAKIHAFAVREIARNQGIGTELQRQTIHRARALGCYQVASYSSYGRDANHHIKLSLGFAAQPEAHGDNHQGIYFIMPLISFENMPEVPALRFRRFRGENDYGPIAAVLTASQRADHYDRSVTAENIATAYANALVNCDPYADMIMAEVAGELVGYVRGWWEEESPSLRLYKHLGVLLPAWRRKGLGRAMLNWTENRLRDLAAAHPQEAKKYFQANVSQFQTGAAILLARAGYQPVRYFFEMVRPNLEDIPDFPLPDGLEIRPVTSDQYRAIWESSYSPNQEEWGIPEPTEAAYQEWLKDPLFQPHLWQVAWDKETGHMAGHVLTYIHHEDNSQFGRKRGYTEGVGVAREWRRRGLARALISRSLQAQKAAGMSESALVADRDSASGVTRLYESCGFQIVKCDTIYRKPV